MRSLNVSILAVALLASIAWADTTWVAENIEGGIWNLEGSPYIITAEVSILNEGEELSIEPGVEVLLAPYSYFVIQSSTLIANGSPEDSIYFYPLDNYWGHIMIEREGAHSEFSYCHFFHGGHGRFDNTGAISTSFDENFLVRHCTFENCFDGIKPAWVSQGIIEYCLFKNIGGYAILTNNAVVSRCVFIADENYFFDTAVSIPGYIENCVYIRTQAAFGVQGILYNCIFIEGSVRTGSPNPQLENHCDINHSIFFGKDLIEYYFQLYNPNSQQIPNIGILDRVNVNGDSSDCYGNIFLDPGLVAEGDYPDYYHILEDSPCIDAGNPEGDPDRDGTIADMGAYFFPQRNILVDPDRFDFVTREAEKIVEVTIHNIGLQDLTVFSVSSIAEEGSPFSLLGGPILDWIIEPHDSIEAQILFAPPRAGFYLADMRIISNDRDQDTLTIELIGHSLGVEEAAALPTDFTLSSPYPNPFNSAARVDYSLAAAGRVSLRAYDLTGRVVDIVDEVDWVDSAGRHSVSLDAEGLAAGVYILELRAGGEMRRVKAVVVK